MATGERNLQVVKTIQMSTHSAAYFRMVRYYLLEWRTARRLSQRELSKRSAVATKTIAQIEEEPEKERLAKVVGKIARGLGIDPELLKKHPSEAPNSVLAASSDITDEEIEDFLKTVKTLRYRGNLSEDEIDSVTKALIKDLIIEERKKGK